MAGPPGDLERAQQMERDIQWFENFRKFIGLMLKLFDLNLLELQHRQGSKNSQQTTEAWPYLVLAKPGTAEDCRLLEKFRAALGLDPQRTEFRVTERLTGRNPDEITIQTRSLLTIMSFLSREIQVPERIRRSKWVIGWEDAAEA